jgi:glycosyltransferase involved in cell wall biosynthesis
VGVFPTHPYLRYDIRDMLEPLVSVIIPTFNRACLLTQAVQSALSQSHRSLEVLVIDDGSTDGTETSLKERFAQEPRLRYVRQPNQGVSAARNRGLAEARGELVAFLDSDDVWLPGKLERQVAVLAEFPEAGMVWTDMDAIDGEGNLVERSYLRKMYRAYRWFPSLEDLFASSRELDGAQVYAGDIYSPMVLGNLVHTSTVLIRKSRLEKVGLFRVDYRRGGEDYEFHLRTCREGPVAFIDQATIRYRIGLSDALTNPGNNAAMALAYLETLKEALARDRSRIILPPGRLDECLAEAHAWAARELLVGGEPGSARAHFRESFRLKPWQPSQFKFMGAALLPDRLQTALVRGVRRLRR